MTDRNEVLDSLESAAVELEEAMSESAADFACREALCVIARTLAWIIINEKEHATNP